MREIKFRIWHDDLMYTVFQMKFHNHSVSEVHAQNDEAGSRYHTSDMSKCVLMQFTGMLDKNGKEIYEGDIVQIEGLYGDKERVQVLWGKTSPMYEWMSGETWLLSRFSNGNEGTLYPYCQSSHGFEVSVVGNIYETPELLPKLEVKHEQ